MNVHDHPKTCHPRDEEATVCSIKFQLDLEQKTVLMFHTLMNRKKMLFHAHSFRLGFGTSLLYHNVNAGTKTKQKSEDNLGYVHTAGLEWPKSLLLRALADRES